MLSPTIRIDDEVYSRLQSAAVPFVDTPNTVLRRLLGLDPAEDIDGVSDQEDVDEGVATASPRAASERKPRAARAAKRAKKKRTRVPSGAILPEDRYVGPLLRAITDRGGQAPAREVIAAIGEELGPHFTELDQDRLASGMIRWQNRAQFVRLRLIEQGLLEKDAPRGVWAITDEGRRHVAGASPTSGGTK